MRIECYCYTRGEQPDYRDFCIPTNVGQKIVSALHNMVVPVLERKLDTPRWILYKKQDVVVWGICCENELLSSSCYVDIKGRPVKGFFAFVCSDIDEGNISIPSFDISSFKDLYEKEVASYWNCLEGDSHKSHVHSFNVDGMQRICARNNEYSVALNTNAFQCVSLGYGNKHEVVAAALSFPEISLLIDNEDLAEAIGKKEPFMNCFSSRVAKKVVKVKRICPQCHKYVDEFTGNGICPECEKANNRTEEDTRHIEPYDMEHKELKQLEKKLRDCEFYIEESNKALIKERRVNRILLIICGIFLLLIAYLWHNSKSNISKFGNKKEVVCDTVNVEKKDANDGREAQTELIHCEQKRL